MNLNEKQSLIFNHYGLWFQVGKLKEELNELLDEIKLSEKKGKLTSNFASELSDVSNLCEQLAMHISQYQIKTIQHQKCDRQLERIRNEFIRKN